ncbi:hypothetical protein BDF19DRAFT_494901 [Syncephalis fuscata]|nr:hypothetical protein BDF19DRAFT_494901 [Syncephalis fuscata]
MHPLKRFNVPHPNFPKETKDNCFIYTRAPGATLKEFIIDKTWQQKAQYLPQIFYQVTQGMLYLRRVGIIHYDIDHENVMVYVNAKNNMVQATIIDYDCVSFIYGSIQKTLELAPYTNLDMINGHDQKRYCNIGNSLFSTTIHFAITEAVIIDEFDDIVQGSFEMISGIFDATAKGLSVSPDKRYGVVYDRKPQYPSKMDEPYAKVLYPLVKAMKKLYDSSYGCAIPNDVLALLGFANMK